MSRQVTSREPRQAPHARVPVSITAFVGRARELEELRELLAAHRLVTLLGAAGSGKTRLAVEAVRPLAVEVAWIELGALPEGSLVAGQVAALLGLRHQAGSDVLDTLVATLAPRSLLLVLDNCEHVVDACAELALRLLQACPRLRILATSRQPLGIGGERSWLVPPLALPSSAFDFESAAEAEAVQLFAQRAADVVPGFALTPANIDAVVRVCRRLDGLPLAIELAAARANMLPPEQLVRRLDDVLAVLTTGRRATLPRHRTLRALLDWSYELLEPQERMLLRRLAVFAGGFTLDAAESVPAAGDIAACDVLDLLASLVDRSLVCMREHAGGARYALLETVRQYALARLQREEAPDTLTVLHERHARYYLARAETADDSLHSARELTALTELDVEHDNLRAALSWSLARGDAVLALSLCRALGTFWSLRGHHTEGSRWIGQALDLDVSSARGLAAHALTISGGFARMQGQHDVARVRHAQAVALARAAGDRRALADALTNLGSELALHRDLAAAETALTEAVALRRELGVPWALSEALSARAGVALTAGDAEQAHTLRLEAAAVSRHGHDRAGEARALVGLGEVARLSGRWAEARAHNERAIELFRQLGETWHMSAALQNLGWIAAAGGDYAASLRAFAEFFEIFVGAGNRGIGAGLCLAGVAPALHAHGESELAARALGTAHVTFAAVGIKPAAADLAEWERMRDVLRAALGDDAFERAWNEALPGDPVDAARELLARARAAWDAAPAAATAPAPATAPTPAACEPCAPILFRQADRSPDLCVLALGPLRVLRGDRAITPDLWGSARARELLLYLLTAPGGRTREQVAAAFWPDATAAQVGNSFHVTLYRLRKALGHTDWIVLDGDRYRVAPHVALEFDARTFEEEAGAVLRHVRDRPDSPMGDADAARLTRAVELYRGDFLEDAHAGEWARPLRDRLQRLHADALLALGSSRLERGLYDEAGAAFRRLIARDDLHEGAYRGLMQVLARTGHRADALRLYQRLTALLRSELSAEPEPATTALAHALGQPAGATPPLTT